jgi:O-antigen ligase
MLVRAYLFTALASAVVAVGAVVAHFAPNLLTLGGKRGKAFFEDPNVFGPFLIPIALILIEEILNPRLLRSRTIVKVGMLIVLMLGLLFSFSRVGWVNFAIALVVMLVVLGARRGGGKHVAVLVAMLAIGGVAVGGALAVTGQLNFLHERAKIQGYDTERFNAQRQGIKFGEEHILGIGPGQFEVLRTVPAHNLYTRTFAEQGFLGFFAIIALVLATLVFAVRNAVLGRDTYGIGAAPLLAAWVGMAVEAYVIDPLHWRHMFLIAGLIWAGARSRPESLVTSET